MFALKTVTFLIAVLVLPVAAQGPSSSGAGDLGEGNSKTEDSDCMNFTCPDVSNNLTAVETIEYLSPDIEEFSSAKKTHSILSYICVAILSPILHTVGIIGNIVILIVLYQGAIRSPSKPYFVGLATSDLLLLLTSFPFVFRVYDSISNLAGWKTFYAFAVSYMFPLTASFYTTGVWVTVAFTIERFIVICFPMQAQKYVTQHRARVTVVCMYIFGFALNFTSFFRRQPIKTLDDISNTTLYTFTFTELGKTPAFNAVIFWSTFSFNIVLPFVSMTFLNCLILRGLTLARTTRKAMTSASDNSQRQKRGSQEEHVTRILLSIICAFFACNICSCVANAIVAVEGVKVYRSWEFRTLHEFAHVLSTTNSVLNCLLYALCSKSVRNLVVRLVLPCYRVEPILNSKQLNNLASNSTHKSYTGNP